MDSPDALPEGDLPGTVCVSAPVPPPSRVLLEDLTLPSHGHALPRSGLPASVQKGRMKYLEVRRFQ